MLLGLVGALCGLLAPSSSAQQVVGINDHLLRADIYPARYARLHSAALLGAAIVRVDLRWDQLEPESEGQYDPGYVSAIDSVVSAARAFGIKPLFTVLGTPCWASTAPAIVKQGCTDSSAGDGYPPANDAYYARAMQFLARRYGKRVAGWELWNEPNMAFFWNSGNPARDYTNLVKAAYPAIKAVCSVPVIAGSVSLSNYDFVSQLYADGIKGSFDVL